MTEAFNFSEFYEMKSIPIKEKDLALLHSNRSGSYTHWLLFLVGKETDQNKMHWHISVYPSNQIREYEYQFPCFTSIHFCSMDEALDFARMIEKKARQDQFYEIMNPLEKIEN